MSKSIKKIFGWYFVLYLLKYVFLITIYNTDLTRWLLVTNAYSPRPLARRQRRRRRRQLQSYCLFCNISRPGSRASYVTLSLLAKVEKTTKLRVLSLTEKLNLTFERRQTATRFQSFGDELGPTGFLHVTKLQNGLRNKHVNVVSAQSQHIAHTCTVMYIMTVTTIFDISQSVQALINKTWQKLFRNKKIKCWKWLFCVKNVWAHVK